MMHISDDHPEPCDILAGGSSGAPLKGSGMADQPLLELTSTVMCVCVTVL